MTLLRRGEVVDSLSLRHGIRTVVLDRTSVTTEDGDGEFRFIVNGDPIFVLGTNWVPLDVYHARDLSRLASVLDLLDEIGCNMVRCWGGNVYESDAFFDWCDEHGVMVWQDFAMACAIYPQDSAFQEVLRTEVTAVARRLRQHPSLVLWAGDNECDQKHVRTGQGRDPNLNVLTRSVIPEVLRLEDPSRPYLPSSPYIDDVGFLAGERFLPEDHLWGPRVDFKGDYYSGALCHFASEIGYLGAPSVEFDPSVHHGAGPLATAGQCRVALAWHGADPGARPPCLSHPTPHHADQDPVRRSTGNPGPVRGSQPGIPGRGAEVLHRVTSGLRSGDGPGSSGGTWRTDGPSSPMPSWTTTGRRSWRSRS